MISIKQQNTISINEIGEEDSTAARNISYDDESFLRGSSIYSKIQI